MNQITTPQSDYSLEDFTLKDADGPAPLPCRPFFELLDDAAQTFADCPCLEFLGKRSTYRDIAALVNRAAKGFQMSGVRKGVRVGLFLPNTPYFVICYFAILKAGGTVVSFNPLYTERELKQQIDDSGVETMVTLDLADLYAKLAQTGLKRIIVCSMAAILPFPKNWLFPIVKRNELATIPRDDRTTLFHALIANDGHPDPVVIDAMEDVAVLQYTGGATGMPKGVLLTHANLCANTEQFFLWFPEIQPGQERILGVLPLFHVFAMTAVMNLGIRLGAEIILLPRFNLDEVMQAIHRKKPTLFPAVPPLYTAINLHKNLRKFTLSSIRICFSGGAPLPIQVKRRFEASTGCTLVEGYGLSEASPVVTINPLHGVDKPSSIGLPIFDTMIKIVSLDDSKRTLPAGMKGEICVRGPQVMTGYWNQPRGTAEALVDGWLHTGDVGYMDEEGYVFIVDRAKDLILIDGLTLYPRNIEEMIYLHPAVAECVVLGAPDEVQGQAVKVYVRVIDGQTMTQKELRIFLKDKLSPIEIPKIIEFRKELPRNLIGNLSRKDLLEEMKNTDAAPPAPPGDDPAGGR